MSTSLLPHTLTTRPLGNDSNYESPDWGKSKKSRNLEHNTRTAHEIENHPTTSKCRRGTRSQSPGSTHPPAEKRQMRNRELQYGREGEEEEEDEEEEKTKAEQENEEKGN